jgi:hypothetical protein
MNFLKKSINKQIRMCNHHNILLDEYGTSTCADCYVYFDKSFCSEFTTNHNGPTLNFLKTKSTIINTLEKEFGISDSTTTTITEKIFNLTSKNKMVKGTNKRSILCASLYYAYRYLEKPKNFNDMLRKFNIDYKNGSKGLKMCQIAIQESFMSSFSVGEPNLQTCHSNNMNKDNKTIKLNFDEIKKFKGHIHSFASTHKEKLQELLSKYHISLKNYDEIEKIIIAGHLKKNKILNDKSSSFWVSCIYFWLIKINPLIDPEEFISLNSGSISLVQLRTDLNYLKKNLS